MHKHIMENIKTDSNLEMRSMFNFKRIKANEMSKTKNSKPYLYKILAEFF